MTGLPDAHHQEGAPNRKIDAVVAAAIGVEGDVPERLGMGSNTGVMEDLLTAHVFV
ncbi:MAG: hypothetical protein KJ053_05345 [Dehalococcoidia bacterium]|nr:hypothetical protein [Dehalococcoidia bacterium]